MERRRVNTENCYVKPSMRPNRHLLHACCYHICFWHDRNLHVVQGNARSKEERQRQVASKHSEIDQKRLRTSGSSNAWRGEDSAKAKACKGQMSASFILFYFLSLESWKVEVRR
eukprot:767834-Hanusia_phi.AAC.5